MYDKIEAAIKGAGIAVYPPATEIGEVKSPYAVVHDMGTVPKPGSKGMLGQHLYEILCLVPVSQQRDLSGMVKRVRAALRPLASLQSTGDSQPTNGLAPNFKGASMSLIYAATCTIR